MKPGIVRVERTYPHARALVWSALTDSELLSAWLMPTDFSGTLGHRFTFRTEPGPGFDGVIHCEVLEMDPEERMVWSWRGGPLDTRVTFTLTEVDGGTRLLMEHTGFRGLKARLVQRILAIGCRTLYGKRLPTTLAELEAGDEPASTSEIACMDKEQGALRWLLARFTPKKRGAE